MRLRLGESKLKLNWWGTFYTDDLHVPALITNNSFFVIRIVVEEFQDTSLDALFREDDSEMLGDDSDSDGFLSEF